MSSRICLLHKKGTEMNEIQLLLIQALELLELGFDKNHQTEDDISRHSDLMWAAHEHVQRAWGIYAQHSTPHKISQNTNILVSTLRMLSVVSDASRKS
jgi:hypothetical protein